MYFKNVKKWLGVFIVCGLLLAACLTAYALADAETPVITGQPVDKEVFVGETAELTITAIVTQGNLSYQWYSNTSGTNSGGTAINGATGANYNAPTASIGTTYYYCVVTNTDNNASGNKTATATSNAVSVTVDTPTYASVPNFAGQLTDDRTVTVGETALLEIIVDGFMGVNGTLSYQWYSNTSRTNSGGAIINGATSASYNAPTSVAGTTYYYCVVTNTKDDATGNKTAAATSNAISVTVNNLTNAQIPDIPLQYTYEVVLRGDSARINVNASVEKGTLSYQWYSNNIMTNSGGTIINGAIGTNYNTPISTSGYRYYYCVVTNTDNEATGNKTATATSLIMIVETIETLGMLPSTLVNYYIVSGNGWLTVRAGGENIISLNFVEFDTDIIYTAAPHDGYRVKEWKDNGLVVNGTNLVYVQRYNEYTALIGHTVTVEFELIGDSGFSGAVLCQSSPRPATVELFNSSDTCLAFAETAADGSYNLTAPAGSGYTLVVSKPGYLKYTVKNLTLADGEAIDTIDIRQMAGDIDGDGVVNATDLTYLLSEFNRDPVNYEYADIDGNGVVNATDLTYLLAGFNKHDTVIEM